MNEITLIAPNGHAVSYDKMRKAIAQCDRLDELKSYADKSVAMAAYFKQIKDDSSVRKFKQIRIRAFRRLGEMFAAVKVDKDCTNAMRFEAIRKHFKGDQTIKEISDSTIYQCLRLATFVSEKIFEGELESGETNISAVIAAPDRIRNKEYWESPAGKTEQARREAEHIKWRQGYDQEQSEKQASDRAEIELQKRLRASYDMAVGEVGFTMQRRDREEMHQIVFLLKRDVYEILRKAAFEERITMQAALRRGLAMWLTAFGYSVPDDDSTGKPPRSSGKDTGAQAGA